MEERARQRELRNAGVVAAREARQQLARAIALLDDAGGDGTAVGLAAELSNAVGSLFGCEIGEASAVLEKLRAASAVLSGVLARLHGPALGTRVDEAGELVAASLAVLYPVRAGLERDLIENKPAPSRPARRTFTVKGSAVSRESPTLADALPEEQQAELEAVRVLSAQAGATVLDLSPPVHIEARADEAAQLGPAEPAAEPVEASERRPISVRPLPLVDRRPPPEVQTLLTMTPDAVPEPSRASVEAAALFPEAGDDALPPLLLLDKRGGRKRRRALELVPDASGELIDARSGEHRNSLTGAERRVQERVDLEVDIGLHSATQFYAGLSNDISEGGLFVSTIRPLPVGSELTISFVLPGGHAVTTRGRVAWLSTPRDEESRPGMGVRFVRLEPEHRAAIDKFLKYRPPMLHEL